MPLTASAPNALSRIYAASLFELAQAQGGQPRIEETLAELEEVLEMARDDAMLGEFLSSRILRVEARGTSIKAIFEGRVSPLTYQFLQVVNAKGRLASLPAIAASFDELVQQAFGRVEVDVYTPAAMSPDELAAIKSRLHAVLGKEPVLHAYADPEMIGGVRLQIGDQLIDASIASELRRIRDALSRRGGDAVRANADRMIG